jgi:glutamine amidotransferase
MIAVVDYGVGNLANVERALRRAGARAVSVTRDHDEILSSRAVVLPGVGHFGHCSRELHRRGLDRTVRAARARALPLLGLCVGMQLFFEASEEDDSAPGLGLYCGMVRRLDDGLRVPHTGWNSVRLRKAHPWLSRIPDEAHFYFVHSYAADPEDDVVLATTEYGRDLPAIVGGDGILGVQFHPERSSLMGQRLLEGFVRGVGEA